MVTVIVELNTDCTFLMPVQVMHVPHREKIEWCRL